MGERASAAAPGPRSDEHPLWSVLLVFYDGVEALRACLDGLARQRDATFEAVVVDNRGESSLPALVQRYRHARLLTPSRNLGYGGGNNLAARAAVGEYLLILNPDVLPLPDLLARLTDAMHRTPDGAVVTATLLLPDGRVNAQGNDVSYAGLTFCRHLGAPTHEAGLHAVPAVSGAALAVRRRDFWAIGGFDERFFMYLEDTDLSLRAVLAGGSCWCAGEALAVHDYRWRFSPRKQLELEKNRWQLLLKLLRPRTLAALLPGLFLAELATWAYALLRGPAYTAAKRRSYRELWSERQDLLARRRQVQLVRREGDAALLRRLTWRIPLTQQLGRPLGATLSALLAPAFAAPYFCARLLSRLSLAKQAR